MAQTTITRQAIAVPGLLADNTLTKDCLTATSEESSAQIPFGVMVGRGSADDGVLKLATTSDVLAGVVVFGQSYDHGTELGSTGFLPKTTFNILNEGRIYVQVEENVTPASRVFVRAVATGLEVAGAFRDTQDGSDCIEITDYARYLTTTLAGGLAVLDISMRTSRAVDAT